MMIKKILRYFSPFEWALWGCSVLAITLSSLLIPTNFHILSFISSLLGVTALIFLAKGNVTGQFIVIVFSILYAIVALEQRYYGELITYLGMTLPSAAAACISWLRHLSEKKTEVKIATLTAKKCIWIGVAAVVVTTAFYFILAYFETNNLIVSTFSIAASFVASMLTIFRSPYYALAYAVNDVVRIVLWITICFSSIAYLPTAICFTAFLFNDVYAFINWRRMQKRQAEK